MSVLQIIALVVLAIAALLALLRMFRGPTTADRVVAADALAVITTPGIAWLALALNNVLYLDVALVYGALSFVGVVALARAMEGGRS
jgi:multisubunit Na+/H+ antiporter MnhF subunit